LSFSQVSVSLFRPIFAAATAAPPENAAPDAAQPRQSPQWVEWLEERLTALRERAYEIAGQSVVDLSMACLAMYALLRATVRIQLGARRRFWPNQISVYLLEPITGSHGGLRLSTRTLARLNLAEIYQDDPRALRMIRKAQRAAAKHSELPICFFPAGSTARVFTNLNKHMSSIICGTDSALVAMNNAIHRLASVGQSGSIRDGVQRQVPMQRVFLLYTFERYDAVRTRVIWLPADLDGWYRACMRIRDSCVREATAQRLVRHLEIATSIVLRRPDLVEGYCGAHCALWDRVQRTALAMRKLLVLSPKASFEFLQRHLEADSKPDSTLSAEEERRLCQIWYRTDAVPPDKDAGRDWFTYIEVPSTRGDRDALLLTARCTQEISGGEPEANRMRAATG
jgi:hypothetical protein